MADPIVCLPGFLGDARVFAPLQRTAPHLELIPLDLPLRTLPPAGHLLCGSYGGLVAARLPPERIRSLVLVATLPHRSLLGRWFPLTRVVDELLPDATLERLYLEHSRRSLRRQGVDLDTRGLPAWRLRDRLRQIRGHPFRFPDVPTLWVLGQDDPQAPTPAQVRRHQPHADVVVVPGGHRPYATHPEALLSELERWWASVG